MINFLLNSSGTSSAAIIAIIFAVGIVVSILIVVGIKRVEKKSSHKMVSRLEPKNINLKLKTEYLDQRHLAFLNVLHKALPPEFIAFPHVGLSQLVDPTSDMITYNLVQTEFVDVCIFAKSKMEPLLAIDLYKAEDLNESFSPMSELARKALKTVKLNFITVNISSRYDVEKLRHEILSNMHAEKVVLYLRSDLEESKDKY